MIRNIMYMRPGNLYKEFVVESNKTDVSTSGRPIEKYDSEDIKTLKGSLADATAKDIARFGQNQHPITHTIVQPGRPLAKANDKLILDDRVFLVWGVDEAGSLGVCTIYYAEERKDIK